MSDHPSQIPDPQATSTDRQREDRPSAPPDQRPAEEKSVAERAEDEAAAFGDFA